jgi:hypothetical protein
MMPGDTLAGLLEEYAKAAEETAELIARLPDLDAAQRLPEAPWFPPGARWSARRVLLHVIAETAQHAGTPTSSGSPSTAPSRWAKGVCTIYAACAKSGRHR